MAAANNATVTTAPKRAAQDDESGASHHKYCHFCQHVKIRSSSMLGCQNPSCMRRFCRHCLLTHLGEDEKDMDIESKDAPPWYCPICRNRCCCAKSDCTENHRHCKAYRYRCSRAEKSIKRATSTNKKLKRIPTAKQLPSAADHAHAASSSSILAPSSDLGCANSGGFHSLLDDAAAHTVSWETMMVKGQHADADADLMCVHEDSSPPPLEVYESECGQEHGLMGDLGSLSFDQHLNHLQFDHDSDAPDADERAMNQLLGRMQARGPNCCVPGEDDASREMYWLKQSYLVVYQPQDDGQVF